MTLNPPQIRLVHVMAVPQSLTFLHGQVDYVRRKGFEVHALTSPGRDLQQFGDARGISVHEVVLSRSMSPLRDLRSLWALRRTLRQIRPHIVVGHMSKAGLLGTLAARLAGVPVCIYQNHGMALFSSRGWRKAILWISERATCTIAHRVLTASDSVRQAAIASKVCARQKISLPANGSVCGIDAQRQFNPDRFDQATRQELRRKHGIPDDAIVLGFVGRIVPLKGIAELVASWKSLRAEFPNLHLLIAGDFDPDDKLPEPVERELRSDPRIHLTGFIRETAPIYAIMDVFCLPSYHEGFPVTHLEAAAMGVPAVSTSVPGNIDAVRHGETGVLVPARDVAALTDAIRGYLSDPDLRARHGGAGRDRMLTAFRPESVHEALYQEYLGALRSRGLAPLVSEAAS